MNGYSRKEKFLITWYKDLQTFQIFINFSILTPCCRCIYPYKGAGRRPKWYRSLLLQSPISITTSNYFSDSLIRISKASARFSLKKAGYILPTNACSLISAVFNPRNIIIAVGLLHNKTKTNNNRVTGGTKDCPPPHFWIRVIKVKSLIIWFLY